MLSAYYFSDGYTLNNPYPVAQSGASVPGFNALYFGRAQLLSLGDTKTLGSTAVNEFHFSYMRDYNDLGKPVGGLGVSLASQGFLTGAGTPGIVPLDPQGEGVENIVFNTFSIGTNANELKQVNNTFQWIDNFSKVLGRHTIKLGAEFHYDQVNTNPDRSIQWELSVHRERDGVRLCRFPARNSEPVQPESTAGVLRPQQILGTLRARQLARAFQPDAELWSALGSHRALV